MKLTKPAANAAKTVVSMPSPKALEVLGEAPELGVGGRASRRRDHLLPGATRPAPAPARDQEGQPDHEREDGEDRDELGREPGAAVLRHREDVLAVLGHEAGLDLVLRE